MITSFLHDWPRSARCLGLLGEFERLLDSETNADGKYAPFTISKDGDLATLRFEIPGVDPKSLDVEVNGANLKIKGERNNIEGVRYVMRERPTGSFRRTVKLPFTIDAERVEATYRNGVLEIVLHRVAAEQARKITIQS